MLLVGRTSARACGGHLQSDGTAPLKYFMNAVQWPCDMLMSRGLPRDKPAKNNIPGNTAELKFVNVDFPWVIHAP